jgi:hypothetical protein
VNHSIVSAYPDDADRPSQPVFGPFLYTFSCRIPFVLGVADGLDHEINLPASYADPDDAYVFQRDPFVRLRIFNAPIADRKFWPVNMPRAIEYFYDGDIGSAHDDDTQLYEQWVSLETPAAFLVGESLTDPAYAFHRSLGVLNLFLQAFALARDAEQVRPVSARELRPIVIIGSLSLDGMWRQISPMLMHPDGKSRPLSSRPGAQHAQELNSAMLSVLNGEPFVRARQWRARAERRKYEGDSADSIVSFQIAAESIAYELWGLLLIDEGVTAEDVRARRATDVPYKSLLTRELATRMGGPWDLTSDQTAVGRYWSQLYRLRNWIIHAGYQPHDGDAEHAESAFVGFDQFLESRLQANRRKYPEALRAKLASLR